MEQAHTYTILGRGMSGLVLAETSGARSLEDACNLTFYCTVPVAWFEGDKEVVGNLDDDQDLRERVLAECIAAGRVIELVDGKYVPRGVPVPSTTPTLDKLEAEWVTRARVRVAEKRAADPNYAMIARDGPQRDSYCVCRNHKAPGIYHRTDGPCFVMESAVPAAKPALAALTRISSMSHMLGNGIKG